MLRELVFIALAVVSAFVAAMVVAPFVINALRRMKLGQTIQKDGPQTHFSKAGTPTMGGVIIVFGVLVGALISLAAISWATPEYQINLTSLINPWMQQLIAVVALVLGYALVGLIDDYLTIKPIKGVRGIASKPKSVIQFLLAVGFVLWLRQSGFDPVLNVGSSHFYLGEYYWVLAVFFIAGMANFVNITDGLDGLLSGLSIIAFIAMFVSVCTLGLVKSAIHSYILQSASDGCNYEQAIMMAVLWMAGVGACLAFLWFNKYPAKVFMGDTGSLALGSLFPASAIILHKEILMIIVGMVFVLDGFSTIIQWAVFKYTRIRTGTGKRVFLKSPVHHHFEMMGWPEQTVVVRFWICGIIAALIGYAGMTLGWW